VTGVQTCALPIFGYFDDIQDAKRAYDAAKLALHDAPINHRSPS